MSLVDDLVVTCDEIEYMVNDFGYATPEKSVINPSHNRKLNGIDHWLTDVALLAMACLLLLMAIVKYYMKHELKIPCLLSRYASDYHISIKMNSVKEIDIKNHKHYFFNDLINIKNLDPNKIKIDKSHSKILFYTTLDT